MKGIVVVIDIFLGKVYFVVVKKFNKVFENFFFEVWFICSKSRRF